MDGFEHLNIVAMEHVELPFLFFYVLTQLLQALDHELCTVVTEILVFLGVDLGLVKDENRSHLVIFLYLLDEGSVIYDAKITVEEEYIHCLYIRSIIRLLIVLDQKI